MIKQGRPRRAVAALAAAIAIVGAACSADAADTEAQPSPPTTAAMGHDHSASTNTGDATATPAADIEGADLVSGTFATLADAPPSATDISGTADLARHQGTTVTIMLHGLTPGNNYVSHVHADSCANNGGPHYQFEVGGGHHPPNEIHLAFTANDNGMGTMTAENASVADQTAVSVVVHEAIDGSPKLVCADLS